MGHDITAIKDYNEEIRFWKSKAYLGENKVEKHREKNEVAYLRRNMASETIHDFYKFLYCDEVDGGVSGRGYYVIVKLETIKEAMLKIANSNFDIEDKDDYVDFLYKLAKYCKNNKQEGVIIHFG